MPQSTGLPTFVIIGAMNCGTTSLHRYLGLHPEIGMSKIKETNFFLRSSKHDLDWYRAQFSDSKKATGEASPNYAKYPAMPGVPERMHALIPDAQLVYLVRDPVRRIVSHYIHSLDRGREHRSIEAVLAGDLAENHYVLCSRYYLQLSQYLEFYRPEQILVIASEDLKSRRAETLRRVFSFIGVDPDFISDQFSKEHGTSSKKTMETWMGRIFTGTKIAWAVRRLVPKIAEDWLRSLLRRPAKVPDVSPALKQRLCDALRDDVNQLRSFTGKPFEQWQV